MECKGENVMKAGQMGNKKGFTKDFWLVVAARLFHCSEMR